MNDFNKNLAKALFNQDEFNAYMREQLQKSLSDLLESELTAFLGYDPYDRNGWNTGNSRNGVYYRHLDTQFGEIAIKVPRDRNGNFIQHTIPPYQRHNDVLEDTIIKLYSKGVTTREIGDLIEKMYGEYYSAGTVSNITKQITPKIQEYHHRKLNDKFFCIYLDATYISLKRITYEKEAVYIAIGIQPNGHKEVIDYRIEPTESIEIWTEMLNDFKNRGLKQVELFLSDGVVGMRDALNKTYPKASFQRCLVHVMRNISAKVRASDRQKAMDEFKQVHKQSNKEEALKVLHAFYDNWEGAYKSMVRDLKAIEPDLLTFYNYPAAIRASIYSTNMIESFNNKIKSKVKPKAEFPSEESLDNFIGTIVLEHNNRCFNRAHKGFKQVEDTLESYFD
jgi:putative transposase